MKTDEEAIPVVETQDEETAEVIPLTALQRRIRGRTVSIKRMPKRELERGRLENPPVEFNRPQTRKDCLQGENAQRPCPWASCRHHLYLDVSQRSGSIKTNFPHLEIWDMPETCALDIADRGGATLEETGHLLNITRERVRQIETKSLAKIKALSEMAALMDYVE